MKFEASSKAALLLSKLKRNENKFINECDGATTSGCQQQKALMTGMAGNAVDGSPDRHEGLQAPVKIS